MSRIHQKTGEDPKKLAKKITTKIPYEIERSETKISSDNGWCRGRHEGPTIATAVGSGYTAITKTIQNWKEMFSHNQLVWGGKWSVGSIERFVFVIVVYPLPTAVVFVGPSRPLPHQPLSDPTFCFATFNLTWNFSSNFFRKFFCMFVRLQMDSTHSTQHCFLP